MPVPCVSILIPNFNNGRESSVQGDRNFIEGLIRSLIRTLADDPTPLEIIIADDGSTDDSLKTLRKWAGRRWPNGARQGEPIFRLIELEHCGVLSTVANRLVNESQGEILVRLDGDIVINTENWVQGLCRIFAEGPPRLGVVGPKQLVADGSVHAAGDWILHPRGYHHLHQGSRPEEVTRSIEVDHVMGCFYCFRRAVWDEIGEFDENILRGQTIDYGLRARLYGWRCFAVPTIEFTHFHAQRKPRANVADTGGGMADSRQAFFDKWGFDRLAPDLDEVARRYSGTPLLWNAGVFGPSEPRGPSNPRLGESVWREYAQAPEVQQAINTRIGLVEQIHNAGAPGRRLVEVGCGSGLLSHLLAKQGYHCRGFDADDSLIQVARRMTQAGTYPEERPRFEVIGDRRHLPGDDRTADIVTVFDILENDSNPVGLLREAHRLLRPGGVLAIMTAERAAPGETSSGGGHPYRLHELVGQMHHLELFDIMGMPAPGYGALQLAARARPVQPAKSTLTRGSSGMQATFGPDQARRVAA